MPRSSARASRSIAAESCASPVSDSTTSCPASAKTSPISAPIIPAPTTPTFSLILAPLILAAHDRLVIPATIEEAANFDIAGRQDHIGDDDPSPEGDDANTRPQIVPRPSALRKNR